MTDVIAAICGHQCQKLNVVWYREFKLLKTIVASDVQLFKVNPAIQQNVNTGSCSGSLSEVSGTAVQSECCSFVVLSECFQIKCDCRIGMQRQELMRFCIEVDPSSVVEK